MTLKSRETTMPSLTLNVGSNGQLWTVDQMRRRLTEVLAGLNGDQDISFTFIGVIDNYERRTTMPSILGAPYGEIGSSPIRGGLWGYADQLEDEISKARADHAMLVDAISKESYGGLGCVVFGPLARPENG
jgi:hypothetical protein